MKPYRVGIVGSGFGVRVHLPAFLAHPRFEVAALASPHSAARVAKERKIPHAFATCSEMLAGVEVDVVSIASPPFAHHDDVLAALAAGKHVICEKPFALNVAQAQAMVEAAQRAGTATAVMHEFRWVPQVTAIKELLENGHLQPLRLIEISQFLGFLRASEHQRERGWWFEHERGGGIAGAWLSHVIDCANWFAGRAPLASTGLTRVANPRRSDAHGAFESTVADGAFALLDYGEGLIAKLSTDATLAINSCTYAAHAENRTAVASGENPVEMRLFSIDGEETNELNCAPSPYARFRSVNGNVPLIMELLDEFVKQIETGASAVPTFAEALETQRVLESIGYCA